MVLSIGLFCLIIVSMYIEGKFVVVQVRYMLLKRLMHVAVLLK